MATIALDTKEYDKGVQSAQNSAQNLGSFIKKLGIGATLAGIGKKSIEMGMDFEASMSQVAATMGMTEADIKGGSESFKLLEDAAKKAGSTTKFSATESAQALNYLALAGFDAETAVSMLPKVLNLAAAGGMDLAYASDMVTDSMSALGLETKDADMFMNQMAKTSQKSNTSVSQLGEAILTVGGTAKVLKGGTVELNTQLGILADNGTKGAEGGTALRNVILSLSAPTDKAGELMKKLGLNVFDANGNMRATNDIFNDLNGILSTMTQQERTEVLNKLFNKVDLKSVNALLANSGQRFNELSKEIENSDKAADNMAQTMEANLKGSLTTLNSALEGLGIAIYEQIKTPLNWLVTTGAKGVQKLISIIDSGKLDAVFTGIAAALGLVLARMVAIKALGIAGAIASFIGSAVNVINSIKSIQGAMAVLNATLLANPIMLVVSVIGALAGAFIYLWNTSEGFRNFWINAWENIKTFTSNAVEAISNFFTVTIPNAIDNMVTWFQELPSRIWAWLQEAQNKVAEWAVEMWNKAIETGSNFINSISEWFSQLPHHIGYAIGYAGTAIALWAVETWEKAKETGSNFISAIQEWFSQLPTRISEATSKAWEATKNWAANMWSQAKEIGANFVNSVVQWFSQLPSRISTWFNNVVQKAVELKNKMTAKAKEIGQNFKDWLISSIKDLPNKFSNIGKNIVEGVWNGIINMKNWLMDKVSGFFSGLLNGAKAALGIHSPSREFRDEVGKWIPAGVEVGVEREMPHLRRTLEMEMASLSDVEVPSLDTEIVPTGGNDEKIVALLSRIADKDLSVELDGQSVMRGLAPYQEEFKDYNEFVMV